MVGGVKATHRKKAGCDEKARSFVGAWQRDWHTVGIGAGMAKKSVSWFHPSTDKKTRESPNDFMRNYSEFIHQHPEHERITPKAFALVYKDKDKIATSSQSRQD